jgi:hypothetical protein
MDAPWWRSNIVVALDVVLGGETLPRVKCAPVGHRAQETAIPGSRRPAGRPADAEA